MAILSVISDNLIRHGEDKTVTFTPNAHNRAEKLEKLGFDLSAAPRTLDKLIQKKQNSYKKHKDTLKRNKKQEASGLEN